MPEAVNILGASIRTRPGRLILRFTVTALGISLTTPPMAPPAPCQLVSGQYLNNMTIIRPSVPVFLSFIFRHLVLTSNHRKIDLVLAHLLNRIPTVTPWDFLDSSCTLFSLRPAYEFSHAPSERNQCQLPHCHY